MGLALDLHGYQVAEAIAILVDSINRQVEQGDMSTVRVIHGYGSTGEGGKIKTALMKVLAANSDSLEYETDPGNPGCTGIRPIKKLPPGAGIITDEIIEYCAEGKSESKILHKFRNYGDLDVKNTLRRLEKQGRLVSCRRGNHLIYTAG